MALLNVWQAFVDSPEFGRVEQPKKKQPPVQAYLRHRPHKKVIDDGSMVIAKEVDLELPAEVFENFFPDSPLLLLLAAVPLLGIASMFWLTQLLR